jgi:hypothetical protein
MGKRMFSGYLRSDPALPFQFFHSLFHRKSLRRDRPQLSHRLAAVRDHDLHTVLLNGFKELTEIDLSLSYTHTYRMEIFLVHCYYINYIVIVIIVVTICQGEFHFHRFIISFSATFYVVFDLILLQTDAGSFFSHSVAILSRSIPTHL